MLLAVASVVLLPATQAHRDAIRLRHVFPGAWNGLGFARREQGRLDDSSLDPNVADRRARSYAKATPR